MKPDATAHPDIHIAEPCDATAWDAYVDSHPEATGYHRWPWGDVIVNAFRHERRYLIARSGTAVVGVLPLVLFRGRLFGRFLVSLPFVNYGGVLANSPEIERGLLQAAIAEARAVNARYIELRHTRRLFSSLQPKRHKVAMIRHIEQNDEDLWKALDRKVRNQVRKGQKESLNVAIGGVELLKPFYDVFSHNMRDLGTPVYSSRFFREVVTALEDSTRIFVIGSGDTPVAASLVCWYRDTIEVPWASSRREFNAKCPNVLLYWEMLRFASGRGFRVFDFGRSTPGEGTFHFKQQWGAQPHELVWEYWMASDAPLPDLSPKNARFQQAIALWRRLPVTATRTIGPWIVRNIP